MEASIMGWGETEKRLHGPHERYKRNAYAMSKNPLAMASLKILSRTECQKMVESKGVTVGKNQWCGKSNKGQDACQGDSGTNENIL